MICSNTDSMTNYKAMTSNSSLIIKNDTLFASHPKPCIKNGSDNPTNDKFKGDANKNIILNAEAGKNVSNVIKLNDATSKPAFVGQVNASHFNRLMSDKCYDYDCTLTVNGFKSQDNHPMTGDNVRTSIPYYYPYHSMRLPTNDVHSNQLNLASLAQPMSPLAAYYLNASFQNRPQFPITISALPREPYTKLPGHNLVEKCETQLAISNSTTLDPSSKCSLVGSESFENETNLTQATFTSNSLEYIANAPSDLNSNERIKLTADFGQTSEFRQRSTIISAGNDSESDVSNHLNDSSHTSNNNDLRNASHNNNSIANHLLMSNDAEGVWSPDIEQSFQEALAIYPPCGRRKIILSDEGKMYGRNELIARYIKLRTGKTRSRKQVSSHIQVLARKKSRENQIQHHSLKESANESSSNIEAADDKMPTDINSRGNFDHPKNWHKMSTGHAVSTPSPLTFSRQGDTNKLSFKNESVDHNAAAGDDGKLNFNGHRVHSAKDADKKDFVSTNAGDVNTSSYPQVLQFLPPKNAQINAINNRHYQEDSKSSPLTLSPICINNEREDSYYRTRPLTSPYYPVPPSTISNNCFGRDCSNEATIKQEGRVAGNNRDSTEIRNASKCRESLVKRKVDEMSDENAEDDSEFHNGISDIEHATFLESDKLRLLSFSCYVENMIKDDCYEKGAQKMGNSDEVDRQAMKFLKVNGAKKLNRTQSHVLLRRHLFVFVDRPINYDNMPIEKIEVKQIHDKFPGLRELFSKGPTNAFYLVKFWGDVDIDINNNEPNAFYGIDSCYQSDTELTVVVSTKICSFGKQVVEKVETEYGRLENDTYLYRINRSPLCEYMINFVLKLINLPEKYMMNSVLENFTILQVITDRASQEILLCIAYVFEVSMNENGSQRNVYSLV